MSTESTKKRFQDPILVIDAKQIIYPVPEPIHVHTDSSNPGDDRPRLSWLLTADEQRHRDLLLDKVRQGVSLSDSERSRLQYLLSKKGLGDEDCNAKLESSGAFLPR